jgi:nucleoid DNA-binding protein
LKKGTAGEEKRDLKNLAGDIIASYEARAKVVGGIVENTHKMMDGFKEKRGTMANELQEILAKCESLRKKDFDRMMADIVAKQNEREKEVRNMLEAFRKEEEAVAEGLKQLLKKGEEIRIKDFKKMMVGIRQEQEKRAKETGESIADELQNMRREVHGMLDNFKQERQSVAAAWHEMLGLFRREKPAAPRQSPGIAAKLSTGRSKPAAGQSLIVETSLTTAQAGENIKNDNDNK